MNLKRKQTWGLASLALLLNHCQQPVCKECELSIAPENTQVEVSLSKLSVTCLSDCHCLESHKNKWELIIHRLQDGTSLIDTASDYLGTQIGFDNTVSADDVDCNEPPPPRKRGKGGITMIPKENTPTEIHYAQLGGATPENSGKDQIILEDENVIVFFYTLEDEITSNDTILIAGSDTIRFDHRTFISFSYSNINYDSAYNHYRRLGQNTGLTIADENLEGNVVGFTVHNMMNYSVSIFKSTVSNKVLRIAYRNKDRLSKNVRFTQ